MSEVKIETRGNWLTVATGMFLAWSASTFLIRVWAKSRTRTWGSDDSALSAALVAVVIHTGFTYNAIRHGFGRAVVNIEANELQTVQVSLYVRQIFYIISMGLCRISAAFFISHMAHKGPQTKPAQILAAICGVWAIASVLVVSLRGNLTQPWETMDGSSSLYIRWLGVEITGLGLELAIWLLSVRLVWGLQMPIKRRVYVLCAFAVRLGLIPFIVCRLVYLAPSRNTEPTLSNIVPAIITEAALHFSIISASATALKPFLRHFHPSYVIESAETNVSKQSRRSSTSRDPYYRLDPLNRPEKRSRIDPNDNINWKPYQGSSGEGFATAYPSKTHDPSRQNSRMGTWSRGERKSISRKSSKDDRNSVEGGDRSDALVIERTTEVSVQYNERK